MFRLYSSVGFLLLINRVMLKAVCIGMSSDLVSLFVCVYLIQSPSLLRCLVVWLGLALISKVGWFSSLVFLGVFVFSVL